MEWGEVRDRERTKDGGTEDEEQDQSPGLKSEFLRKVECALSILRKKW